MATKKRVSKDVIELICDSSKRGDTAPEIAKALDLPTSTVYNILNRYGLRHPRQGTKSAKYYGLTIKCPNCKATGHLKGARFCYKCGADIRTEGEVLIDRMELFREAITVFPVNEGDKAIRLIQDITDYIRRTK